MGSSVLLAVLILVGQPAPGDTVEAVKFRGNRHFSSSQLSRAVRVQAKAPLDVRLLESDERTLKKLYQDYGYRDAEVSRGLSSGRRHAVVVFHIDEGTRTRVAVVSLSGNSAFESTGLLDLLPAKPGAMLGPDLLPALHLGYGLGRGEGLGRAMHGRPLIEPNLSAWSGGHEGPYLPTDIPGVCLIRGPRGKGQNALGKADLQDIAPTVLDLLRIECPPGMAGRSLL